MTGGDFNFQKIRVNIFQNGMNSIRTQYPLLKLSLSLRTRRQQPRINRSIGLTIRGILHHNRNQIPARLLRQMIPITNKQTQLQQFKTLQRIQNQMNRRLINLLKTHELIIQDLTHALVLVLTLIHSDQRLVAFELLEEGVGGLVDQGDDFYYF